VGQLACWLVTVWPGWSHSCLATGWLAGLGAAAGLACLSFTGPPALFCRICQTSLRGGLRSHFSKSSMKTDFSMWAFV
jgi:hypothetical protein